MPGVPNRRHPFCFVPPGEKGGALLLAAVVFLAFEMLANALIAVRASQSYSDYWVVDYVPIAPLKAGAKFVDDNPSAVFGLARVECVVKMAVPANDASQSTGRRTADGSYAQCKFFRRWHSAFVDGYSTATLRPMIAYYMSTMSSPWAPDLEASAETIAGIESKIVSEVPRPRSAPAALDQLAYAAATMLVPLMLLRRMTFQASVGVSFALEAIRRDRISLALIMMMTMLLPAFGLMSWQDSNPWLEHGIAGIPQGTEAIVLGLAYICILSPIAEEILFRAWLIPFMKRVIGLKTACVLSAAMFFSIHLPLDSVGAAVSLAICTCIYTVIWVRTKSLWLCVLAHAGWNIAVLLRHGGYVGPPFSL